jgi:predicted  nucleic acid-binding Zn-ribbon protein
MPIRIESIHLKNCGPIKDFSAELESLNLIYGANETGKTVLVEFLINSLFRHGKIWNLREVGGEGKISLSGLSQGLKSFSPSTKKKLEDYWKEKDTGFPLNLTRLLVVKGADLSLKPDAVGGIDRSILKSILTRDSLLDQILSQIQSTVQKATLKNGVIQGDQRGLIKSWYTSKNDYRRLEKLLSEIQSNYSQAASRILELELQELRASLELQQDAKRHHAYQLEREKAQLVLDRSRIPDAKLGSLSEKFTHHEHLDGEIRQLKDNQNKHHQNSTEYLWLKNAVKVWEELHLQSFPKPNILCPILGLILLGISLLSALVKWDLFSDGFPWAGIILAALGLGVLGLYVFRLQTWSESRIKSQELTALKEEYLQKFGVPAETLVDVKKQLDAQHESNILSEGFSRSLEDKEKRLDQLTGEIVRGFSELTELPAEHNNWRTALINLQKKSDDLDQKIHNLDKEIAILGVPEKEQSPKASRATYDPKAISDLENQINELNLRLATAHDQLRELKNHACRETGDVFTLPWQDVFANLIDIKQKQEADLKALTAEILAKIGVTQIIHKIEAEEDQKIQVDLNSPVISQLLTSTTGSYNQFRLVDEQLLVSDQYNEFPLQALSTGALDQVQVALRLGLTLRISSGDPLFLILDDAFQHSDWNRREMLVQTIINMAKNGWQIIYLTMDNHLREIISKHGKKELGKSFFTCEIK